jgi:hypothetical protein
MVVRFVDTEAALSDAVAAMEGCAEVAFDAEGEELGRNGPLTIAAFSGIGMDDTFVVDVKALGGSRVFSEHLPSFRTILEDSSVSKITFDCRSDSDALFHQFGVFLRGVLELQVLDQAVRIQKGEAPPMRCIYVVNDGIPYVQSMANVSQRYAVHAAKLTVSHAVWGKRPLPEAAIEYASTDMVIIKQLLAEMRKTELSLVLRNAVRLHGARYESIFRERVCPICRKDKDIIMEEHPIISAADLPLDHPRRTPSGKHNLERWNKAVAPLRSREVCKTVYNDVLFVLQHNDSYTDAARTELQSLSRSYPHFTANQYRRIADPPVLLRNRGYESDDYDYE